MPHHVGWWLVLSEWIGDVLPQLATHPSHPFFVFLVPLPMSGSPRRTLTFSLDSNYSLPLLLSGLWDCLQKLCVARRFKKKKKTL